MRALWEILRPEGRVATAVRRRLHPLYRRLETDVHPLRYLFLEITQRCNLACRHCGSDCGRHARPGELSTDEWVEVIDQVGRDFDPRRLAVVLTGGEPLVHPELDRILEALQRNRLPWGLVTNGWLLSEARIDGLRRRGLRTVTVSLDGLREQHDWLRGRAGAFERAVAGMQRLARVVPAHWDVVTCVHPGNLAELPEVHRLLQRLGVPGWRLFPIFAKGRAAENRELLLDRAGFTAMLRFIKQARATNRRMRIDLSCEGYLPESWDRAVRGEPYFCRAGISVASVLHDGAVAACPNISRRLVQGNIRHDSLRRVWEERYRPFRDRSWLQRGRCADCDHFARCQGNSLHLWDEDSGECGLCTLDLVGEA